MVFRKYLYLLKIFKGLGLLAQALFLFSLLSGCAFLEPKSSSSAVIILKSDKIKLANTAFIKRYNNAVEVQMYSAGKILFTLQSGKKICIENSCMSPRAFTNKFLSSDYPEDILKKIILKKELKIKNIIYKISKNEVYFKDKKRHILVKIKELK